MRVKALEANSLSTRHLQCKSSSRTPATHSSKSCQNGVFRLQLCDKWRSLEKHSEYIYIYILAAFVSNSNWHIALFSPKTVISHVWATGDSNDILRSERGHVFENEPQETWVQLYLPSISFHQPLWERYILAVHLNNNTSPNFFNPWAPLNKSLLVNKEDFRLMFAKKKKKKRKNHYGNRQ